MKKIILAIVLIIGALAVLVVYASAQITTFEECEKAGWLVRGIRIYDGDGSIEKECFLRTGKSFVKQGLPVTRGTNQQDWETKIDEQGEVTVAATPLAIGSAASTWKFKLTFDTHSVELDQDLVTNSVLITDAGREYKPMAWQGDSPGGHHREGTLIFEPIDPVPAVVELHIKDVGGITDRSFTWQFE